MYESTRLYFAGYYLDEGIHRRLKVKKKPKVYIKVFTTLTERDEWVFEESRNKEGAKDWPTRFTMKNPPYGYRTHDLLYTAYRSGVIRKEEFESRVSKRFYKSATLSYDLGLAGVL